VNYGYVPGTLAEDGEEIDAYVLGKFEPVDSYEGVVIGLSSAMMTTRINWLSHGM
jgi:inorganic pyrophosphatase